MIVLAAAIILSLQSSGIIGRANEAKNKSDVANAKQVVAMAEAEWKLDEERIRKEDSSIQNFKDYANKKLKEAGYATSGNGGIKLSDTGTINTIYIGSDNKQAIIPQGFMVSSVSTEDSVTEGLVIYEIADGSEVDWTATASGNTTLLDVQEKYNQYVWVPVDNIDMFEKKDWGVGIKEVEFNTNIIDYEINNINEEKEYRNLVKSISEYGGFYIARYEAGLPSGITNDIANYGQTAGEELTKPLSVKGVEVWNFIPWDNNYTSEIGETSWNNPGCAMIAKNMYATSDSVESHLVYGTEWDATLEFISNTDSTYATNSVGKGWYNDNSNNAVQLTGIDVDEKASNMKKNIYYMAGNVIEWSMERYNYTSSLGVLTKYRVIRGGRFLSEGVSYAAAYRGNFVIMNQKRNFLGFRLALYIK